MKKVLVINEGYSDNFGDQAILESVAGLFSDLNYSVDFVYYSQPSISILPQYDYLNEKKTISKLTKVRLKYKNNILLNVLLVIKNYLAILTWFLRNKKYIKTKIIDNDYDYVIIGGGQLINSSNRISPNIFSIAAYTWTKYINKNIELSFIGIGLAEKFNFFELFLYKRALSKAKKIWVRDQFSSITLSKIFNLESEVIPDVAFSLYSETKKKKDNLALVGVFSFHEYKVKYNKEKISLESFYDVWIKKINELILKGYQVSLFYTTKSDALETLNFKKYLESISALNISIVQTDNLKELNDLFAKSNYVFSGRMHALILGMNNRCDIEAYLTSKKLSSFNDEYINSPNDCSYFKNQLLISLKKHFEY